MAAAHIRLPGRRLHFAALALAIGLSAAACSGSASVSGGPTSPLGSADGTPAATVSAAPASAATSPSASKGPATQLLTLTGPAGAAGAVGNATIRCNMPSTDGLQISVLGQPADPNLSVFVFVESAKVTVRYDSGSGSTYVERDFEGTGVTSFDPATGAQIDSQLTEVPNQDAKGKLGVLTAISGTVDCGNQLPGSSTLAFTGPTTKGDLGGGLNPVNVECVTNKFGQSVSVIGIAHVGTTPTLVVVSVSSGTLTVSVSGDGFFRSAAGAVAALTATGANVDADAVEQIAAGSTAKPHTIHVSGDAACGTTIGG